MQTHLLMCPPLLLPLGLHLLRQPLKPRGRFVLALLVPCSIVVRLGGRICGLCLRPTACRRCPIAHPCPAVLGMQVALAPIAPPARPGGGTARCPVAAVVVAARCPCTTLMALPLVPHLPRLTLLAVLAPAAAGGEPALNLFHLPHLRAQGHVSAGAATNEQAPHRTRTAPGWLSLRILPQVRGRLTPTDLHAARV